MNIPRHLEIYRNWKCFGLEAWARRAVKEVPEAESAVQCDECGACEKKCPNELPIRKTLAELLDAAGLARRV